MSESNWLNTPLSAFNDLGAVEYFRREEASIDYILATFFRMGKSAEEANGLVRALAVNEISHLKSQLAAKDEELRQQRFNNKHNLSIDQKVSDEIEQLKKENEALKAGCNEWREIAKNSHEREAELHASLEKAVKLLEEIGKKFKRADINVERIAFIAGHKAKQLRERKEGER